jgi:hypothetical protein
VPQAVRSPAARRLRTATSNSWLDLLNVIRIFRKRKATSSSNAWFVS